MKKASTFFICFLYVFFAVSLSFATNHQQEQQKKKTPVQNQEAKKKETKKPPPKKEKAFDDVIKDAKKLEGLFNLYQKEDKLYMEVLPQQFGKMYLFIPTLWRSVGRGGAGSYLPLKVFTWEKLEKKILFIWKNTRLTVKKSPQYKRALKNVVPESIFHAFKIESEPHPERKSLLISLDDCFLSDLAGISSPPYSIDKRRSVWGKIKSFPENVELEVRYTLASSKPRREPTVPDSRAFTLNVRYSISELPLNNGYRPRLADDRVGYFVTKVYDYDKLDIDGTVVRYINRWHLEKKNPQAKISEPKKPIVFWLENTIPLEYRKPIRDGILEWNKAFEKAGFKNAMVVKEMPDDAEWDPADVRYNTIRWIPSLTGSGGGAMGPSRANPLTGQILDADVTMRAPMAFMFTYYAFRSPLKLFSHPNENSFKLARINPWDQDNFLLGQERDFGILDMLANGKIKDIKEVPKEYIYSFFKFLACHEVGHTLGLRHNFKGSSTIKLQDLHNTKVTSKKSIGNSIMEYLPSNLAPKGVKQGEYYQSTIGAWDYWVIEYGYRPIKAKSTEEEVPMLHKIASRSTEPELIYGTDEDAYDYGPYSSSIDPLSITFDLSSDPLSYTEQQVNRTKDIWEKLEDRILFEGKSYVYLRRAFESSLSRFIGALDRVTKWIGGVYHTRVHVGDPGESLPFKVVEYEKQRRAFDIIKTNLLSPHVFAFDPTFIQKLQIDRFFDLSTLGDLSKLVTRGAFRLDFSLAYYMKIFYQRILSKLYDPMKLHRIQDNETRSEGNKFELSDYLEELYTTIWQELKDGKPVGIYRRALQREYIKRLSSLLLKPSASSPEDATAICRHQFKQLDKNIKNYLEKYPDVDIMTRAHLENCADLIIETLGAGYSKILK